MGNKMEFALLKIGKSSKVKIKNFLIRLIYIAIEFSSVAITNITNNI